MTDDRATLLAERLHDLANAAPTTPDWSTLAITRGGTIRRRRRIGFGAAGVAVTLATVSTFVALAPSHAKSQTAVGPTGRDPRIFTMREVLGSTPAPHAQGCHFDDTPPLAESITACGSTFGGSEADTSFRLGPAAVTLDDVATAVVTTHCGAGPTGCVQPSYAVRISFNDDKAHDLSIATAGGQKEIAFVIEGVVLATPVNTAPLSGPFEVDVRSLAIARQVVDVLRGVRPSALPSLSVARSAPSVEIGQGRMDRAHFTVSGSRDGSFLGMVVDPGDASSGTSGPLVNGTLPDGVVAEVDQRGQDAAPQKGIVAVFPHAESELLGRHIPTVKALTLTFRDGTTATAVVLPAPDGWGYGAWVALVPGWHHLSALEVTMADGSSVTIPEG